MTTATSVKIGCQEYSISNWLKHGRAIARRNGADDIVNEYAMYIITAAMRYGSDEDKQMAMKLFAEVTEDA